MITWLRIVALCFLAVLASCDESHKCKADLGPGQYIRPHNFNLHGGNTPKFPGSGTFLLSERTSDTNPYCNYRATVNNGFKNNNKVPSALNIHIVTDDIYIGQKGDVKINQAKVTLPYTSPSYYYQLWFYDHHFTVMTDCSELIGFDGNHRVYVLNNVEKPIPTVGLCSYNHTDECVLSDDPQTPLQFDWPSLVFGLKWIVPNENGNTDITLDRLSECSDDYRIIAMELCGNLNLSSPVSEFLQFYESLESAGHVGLINESSQLTLTALEDCIHDVCWNLETRSDPAEAALSVIREYVGDVAKQHQVCIPPTEWQNTDGILAPFCGGVNEVFYNNTQFCEPTCGNESSQCSNQTFCGCGCKDGYKRSHNQCVHVDNCGCLHNGKYYKLDERVLDDNCTMTYDCQKIDGQSQMVPVGNMRPCIDVVAKCRPNDKGFYKCQCTEGFVGDGIYNCHPK